MGVEDAGREGMGERSFSEVKTIKAVNYFAEIDYCLIVMQGMTYGQKVIMRRLTISICIYLDLISTQQHHDDEPDGALNCLFEF